jgi:hypothetical protein
MEDHTLVANFELETHEIILLADPEEGGEVIGGGTYSCGEEVTIEAIPAPGYEFLRWETNGMIISDLPSFTFVVTEDQTFIAVFVEEGGKFKITLLANPAEGDVILGEGYYAYGETITVSAVPNPDYDFINWLENGIEILTESDYTFTVTESRTLTGNFETYDVVILSNTPGCGVSGGGNYRPGIEITVSAITKGGSYQFVNWTKDGVEVSTDAEYTFITAIGDIELVANFVETLGIGTVENDGVSVYPNPAVGELRVTSYELQVTSIEIFNIMGQSVGAYPCGRPEITIDISDLPTGVYFIHILTSSPSEGLGEAGVVTKKIIKQ